VPNYNNFPNKNYRDESTTELNVEKNETPSGFSTMRTANQNMPKNLRKKLKRLWEQVVYSKDKLNGKWSIYLGSVDDKVKNEVKRICGWNNSYRNGNCKR
jgi:hypothetical protein